MKTFWSNIKHKIKIDVEVVARIFNQSTKVEWLIELFLGLFASEGEDFEGDNKYIVNKTWIFCLNPNIWYITQDIGKKVVGT